MKFFKIFLLIVTSSILNLGCSKVSDQTQPPQEPTKSQGNDLARSAGEYLKFLQKKTRAEVYYFSEDETIGTENTDDYIKYDSSVSFSDSDFGMGSTKTWGKYDDGRTNLCSLDGKYIELDSHSVLVMVFSEATDDRGPSSEDSKEPNESRLIKGLLRATFTEKFDKVIVDKIYGNYEENCGMGVNLPFGITHKLKSVEK